MKEKYPYLKCVGFKQIDLKEVAIILGQNAYELIRPVEYKNGGENKPWAIKLPLGWTVSGPVPINQLKLSAACHVFNDDDMKLAEVVKKWWDMESYGTLKVADKRTKEDKLATEDQIQRSNSTANDMKLVYYGTVNKQLYPTTFRQHWDNFEGCSVDYRQTNYLK